MKITVSELISILQDIVNQDAEVIIHDTDNDFQMKILEINEERIVYSGTGRRIMPENTLFIYVGEDE